MKDKQEIHQDIKKRFYDKTLIDMADGSVIDLYTLATSSALEETYIEIDNNRTPHIFTKLQGQTLDDTGLMVNLPREPNEDDRSYKYRLMNWTLSNEAGNKTAIENQLLNLKQASYAEYIPFTQGVGTASVYVIPSRYTDEDIELALLEVMDRLDKKISESTHITYIVPEPKVIDIVAYVDVPDADIDQLHNTLYNQLKDYINEIPPNTELEIGEIQKAVLLNNQISYFNIMEVYIDDEIQYLTSLYQNIDIKFLLGQLNLVNN